MAATRTRKSRPRRRWTGSTLHPLKPGDTVEFAFLLIKTIDDQGLTWWAYRTTSPPNREELLGALIVHHDLLRAELVARWGDEEDEEDED